MDIQKKYIIYCLTLFVHDLIYLPLVSEVTMFRHCDYSIPNSFNQT